jgi:hypothetical protein
LLLAFSENGLNVLLALEGLRMVAIGEIGKWSFNVWDLIIVNMAASDVPGIDLRSLVSVSGCLHVH